MTVRLSSYLVRPSFPRSGLRGDQCVLSSRDECAAAIPTIFSDIISTDSQRACSAVREASTSVERYM